MTDLEDEVYYYRKLCIDMELKIVNQAQQIFELREKLKKECKIKEKYYKQLKEVNKHE